MSAMGLTNIEQCRYSPDLNMCNWFLFTRLQNASLWKHLKIENGHATVFEAASKIFVFKRVRETKSHCEVMVWQSGVYTTP